MISHRPTILIGLLNSTFCQNIAASDDVFFRAFSVNSRNQNPTTTTSTTQGTATKDVPTSSITTNEDVPSKPFGLEAARIWAQTLTTPTKHATYKTSISTTSSNINTPSHKFLHVPANGDVSLVGISDASVAHAIVADHAKQKNDTTSTNSELLVPPLVLQTFRKELQDYIGSQVDLSLEVWYIIMLCEPKYAGN